MSGLPPKARIRSFQFLIRQFLCGDFFNSIDPQRSLTRSRFAAVEKCLAFVSADACQSNAFPGSLSIADSISRAAEPNIPQHPIVDGADHCPPFTPQCVGATRLARYPREQAPAILFVNPAHCGVHQIGGRDERVPSARTTARTRSYGRASSTMLKGPCAARRTWRKPPPSFSTSVNFASPAWAPRPSPTSCASDVGTQIMVEAL